MTDVMRGLSRNGSGWRPRSGRPIPHLRADASGDSTRHHVAPAADPRSEPPANASAGDTHPLSAPASPNHPPHPRTNPMTASAPMSPAGQG